MHFSTEFWVAAAIAVIALIVGIGATVAMDPKTKGEFWFATGCFLLSAAAICYLIWMWKAAVTSTAVLLTATVALGAMAVIRWAYGRHRRSANPTEQTVSVRFKHSSIQILELRYDIVQSLPRLQLGEAGSLIQMGPADRDSVMLILPTTPPIMVESPKAGEKYAIGGDLYGFTTGEVETPFMGGFTSTLDNQFTFNRLTSPAHTVTIGERRFHVTLQDVTDKSTGKGKHYVYTFLVSER